MHHHCAGAPAAKAQAAAKPPAASAPDAGDEIYGFLMERLRAYYLDGAVRLLQQSLEKQKSDAVVELFAGKDHGSLLDKKLRARIAAEMAKALGG